MTDNRFPPRYVDPWAAFDERVNKVLAPGARILDVGGGRRPILPPDRRPPECSYVCLDASRAEAELAPPGSYDGVIVGDVSRVSPGTVSASFDLVLSWQVFEHVKPLDRALENVRAFLRPGGHLIAVTSGAWSVFGLINRVVPHRMARWALTRFKKRDPQTVFPAHYHRSSYRALDRMLRSWTTHEVMPFYLGARYFGFSRPLLASYLAFENSIHRHNVRNLATHYLIAAER